MAFQIDCEKEPAREILRAIRTEIAVARRKAGSNTGSLAERVHRARSACKRIRAALRLIRASHRTLYTRENRWFRDSARRLARMRDADVMLTCLGEFSPQLGSPQRGASFSNAWLDLLQRRLKAKRRDRAGAQRELARFAGRMDSAARRLAVAGTKQVDRAALLEGFRKTYRRARRAMPRRVSEGARRFHEWRKLTKFCGYQIRLLRAIRPGAMKALGRSFVELGEILGAEHDLSMVRRFVRQTSGPRIDRRLVTAGTRQIDRRRDERRRAALALGRHVYADKPRVLGRRLQRWQ